MSSNGQNWYDAWAARHARAFGMAQEADLATILSWEASFMAAGYTADELADATDYILAHTEAAFAESDLKFFGKLVAHLGAIRRRITDRRAVVYRREADAHEHDRGTCTLCGGAGRVVVPHPSAVRDGDWVPVKVARAAPSWYTLAVFCRCPLGRWVMDRLAKSVPEGKRFLTLDEYERRNPRWRVQLAARDRSLLADAALQGTGKAGPGDEAFDKARQSLADSWGMPEDDEPF